MVGEVGPRPDPAIPTLRRAQAPWSAILAEVGGYLGAALVIGAAFALIAYFGFAEALGINIGAGWVENGLDSLLRAKGH